MDEIPGDFLAMAIFFPFQNVGYIIRFNFPEFLF